MKGVLPELRLKIRVHGRHPWFYRKMVQRPADPIPPGSAVRVVDKTGRPVGVGFWNPRTDLALRMLARAKVEDPDQHLMQLLDEALALRERRLKLPEVTNGYRLVHGEGDGFPGLILDRLGDVIVAQVFSLCIEQRIEALGERLLKRKPKPRLVLTVDPTARKREGLKVAPPTRGVHTEVIEHDVRYAVQAGEGHKTGFFADQRDNRLAWRKLAKGRRVLDLFCNAGGFALNAALGGAREVRAVDLDEAVLEQTAENVARNDVDVQLLHGDAFEALRMAKPGDFDMLVLDPPKWATGKSQVEDGLKRYFDLNRLGLEKSESGTLVMTCSCSGAVSESRFLGTIRDAAAAARRDARILAVTGAGADHPVALECPETRYLKAVLLEVR